MLTLWAEYSGIHKQYKSKQTITISNNSSEISTSIINMKFYLVSSALVLLSSAPTIISATEPPKLRGAIAVDNIKAIAYGEDYITTLLRTRHMIMITTNSTRSIIMVVLVTMAETIKI